MAAKTLKNPRSFKTVMFKLSLKRKKTKLRKEKPKVTYSVALVKSFFTAENEKRQLKDLPRADFVRLPERFLLLVRTKSITKNLHVKITSFVFFFCSDSTNVYCRVGQPTV